MFTVGWKVKVLTIANLSSVPRQIDYGGFFLFFTFTFTVASTVVAVSVLSILSKDVVLCAIVDVKVPFFPELFEELLPDLRPVLRREVPIVNNDMDS